jgi:hypothetical protein
MMDGKILKGKMLDYTCHLRGRKGYITVMPEERRFSSKSSILFIPGMSCFLFLLLFYNISTESEVTHVHGQIEYNNVSMRGVSNFLYW